MSLEKIIDRILKDASEEASRIKKEAEAQVEELLEKARQEASALREKTIAESRAVAEENRRRAITIAELEARKALLAEKGEALKRAFQGALDRLRAMGLEEYQRAIENMLLRSVEQGDEEVIISSRDRDRLTEAFIKKVNGSLGAAGKEGRLKLSSDFADIEGGFILRTPEAEINGSFEARIRSIRDEAEVEVAKILAGG
jgi:V/A-type H+-transporting ATPase subunit E